MKMDDIAKFDKRFDTATEPFIKVLKALEEESNRNRSAQQPFRPPVRPIERLGVFLYLVALALSINHFMPSISRTYHALSGEFLPRVHENETATTTTTTTTTRSGPDSFLIGIFSEDTEEGFRKRNQLRDYYSRHYGHGKSSRVCSLQDYKKQENKMRMRMRMRMGYSDVDADRMACNVIYTFLIGSRSRSRSRGTVESGCTYLPVNDDDIEAKGQAFLKYAATVSRSFDYVGKTHHTNFYASLPTSIEDKWSLHNRDANTDAPSGNDAVSKARKKLMQFVDADHPPATNSRLMYGSPNHESIHAQSIFSNDQVFFMTMELVEVIAHRIRLEESCATRGDEDSHPILMSDYVVSHLQPMKHRRSGKSLRSEQQYERVTKSMP